VADEVARLQAAAEGVVDAETVEFFGEQFRVAERVGLMPMMQFAHAARSGLDSDDMEGLAACYAMIRDCIHPTDWPRFERKAIDERAEGDDIFGLVQRAMEIITARPTRRPSASPDGPQPTSPSSSAVIESSPAPRVPAGAADLVSVADLLRSVS
jgi:hypothetical protein